MKYVTYTLLTIIFLSHSLINTYWETDPFFDTKFLRQSKRVKNTLVDKHNFLEVMFSTEDNVQLSGLLKIHQQALCNIVCCAGFYPGLKESMATFFRIFPQNCNILFFDARGHGQSNGTFWSNIHNYGLNDYQDIVGAIKYIHKIAPIKTIIIGLCSGAFNAVHALLYIQEKASLEKYAIKGLIFDSGFGSISDTIHILSYHTKQHVLPPFFTTCYQNDSKKSVQKKYPYRITYYIFSKIINITTYFIRSYLQKNDKQTNLFDKIGKIKCPIFFIHAYNDRYVSIEHAIRLASTALKGSCWWIEYSTHACNHLKHKYVYQEKVLEFFKTVLDT